MGVSCPFFYVNSPNRPPSFFLPHGRHSHSQSTLTVFWMEWTWYSSHSLTIGIYSTIALQAPCPLNTRFKMRMKNSNARSNNVRIFLYVASVPRATWNKKCHDKMTMTALDSNSCLKTSSERHVPLMTLEVGGNHQTIVEEEQLKCCCCRSHDLISVHLRIESYYQFFSVGRSVRRGGLKNKYQTLSAQKKQWRWGLAQRWCHS